MTVTGTAPQGWTSQGSHADAATRALSPALVQETDDADFLLVGQRFHQSYTDCRKIDVSLDAPDVLELRRYDGNSPATTATVLTSIQHGEGRR